MTDRTHANYDALVDLVLGAAVLLAAETQMSRRFVHWSRTSGRRSPMAASRDQRLGMCRAAAPLGCARCARVADGTLRLMRLSRSCVKALARSNAACSIALLDPWWTTLRVDLPSLNALGGGALAVECEDMMHNSRHSDGLQKGPTQVQFQ